MVTRYKVGVLEVDGVDLEDIEERPLDADNVYFDNTTNGFTADDTQEAMEELLDLAAFAADTLSSSSSKIFAGSDGFSSTVLQPTKLMAKKMLLTSLKLRLNINTLAYFSYQLN